MDLENFSGSMNGNDNDYQLKILNFFFDHALNFVQLSPVMTRKTSVVCAKEMETLAKLVDNEIHKGVVDKISFP